MTEFHGSFQEIQRLLVAPSAATTVAHPCCHIDDHLHPFDHHPLPFRLLDYTMSPAAWQPRHLHSMRPLQTPAGQRDVGHCGDCRLHYIHVDDFITPRVDMTRPLTTYSRLPWAVFSMPAHLQ